MMPDDKGAFQQRSLVQQGYDYTADELRELAWGLRFTPALCMALAIVGLINQMPVIHFILAGFGIGSFFFPSWHPFDILYNYALRPLWNGVRLPSNPLPRRIACAMGGLMNVGIGVGFLLGNVPLAYAFGLILIPLQIVVITTHFCVASWMFEGMLKLLGRWTAPIAADAARDLIEEGGHLIDVRNPEEFAGGHLPDALNVPLDHVARLADQREQCMVVYCKSGLRAQQAVQALKRRGCTNVHNLGAMSRWR